MDKSTDILEMSDEDFAKLAPPAVTEAPASEAAPAIEEQQAAPAAAAPVVEAPAQTEEQQPAATEQEQQTEEQQQQTEEQQQAAPAVEGEQQPAATPDAAAPAEQQPAAEEFDYKAAYENLLAKPLKANGKEIKLNSVEELVQLAQQGANYTRKMQELAPHRKTLLMLENNGVDADKLDFLIALSKKDPAAIQKYLKDSGVNPLDIDVEAEATYQGGNHRVSDEEAAFANTLEDMQMSEAGKYVLQSIHGTWDQASKELLVTQPNIMEIMRQQHEAGFYDRISAEVDRQRMLGAIPASQSWLQSYKIIGDKMVEQGLFVDLLAKQEPAAQTPPVAAAPVATRVAAPKPTVTADARAAAAAPTRAAPSAAKKLVNPLAMSDDEFMKQFENRL